MLHAAAKSLQSCPTLCDPRDGSPPGSPVPGILQARTVTYNIIILHIYIATDTYIVSYTYIQPQSPLHMHILL